MVNIGMNKTYKSAINKLSKEILPSEKIKFDKIYNNFFVIYRPYYVLRLLQDGNVTHPKVRSCVMNES